MGTWFVCIRQQARDAELSSDDQMKRASPDTSWMPHGSAPFAPRSVACGQLESSKPTSSQPSSQEEEHFQNCGEVTMTSCPHEQLLECLGNAAQRQSCGFPAHPTTAEMIAPHSG